MAGAGQQPKKGMVTLMAEVVWRPTGKPASSTDAPAETTSRPRVAKVPQGLADILADPDYRAEFEARLKSLDRDIGDMCGVSDLFNFYTMVNGVKIGDRLNFAPWTRFFPSTPGPGPEGLQLAGAALRLRRDCAEAVREPAGLTGLGLRHLREAQQNCLNQLTVAEEGKVSIVQNFINRIEERTRTSKLKKAAMCLLL
jgi:hypothetical protein